MILCLYEYSTICFKALNTEKMAIREKLKLEKSINTCTLPCLVFKDSLM